ncbi:hypothetical protein SUGI_0987270 [Cryptomeria japonica]|nr:hypothetical protein SUGI_0987270 [Cryptomeria japonica]
MVDPGFIPGFIGYAIQLAGDEIIHHINVAVRCKKELDALKDLLPRITEMNMELQEYQKALNSGKVSTSSHRLPSMVNSWLNKLSDLLEEASDLAQRCTVPSYFHPISRYTMSRKITQLTANVQKHVEKDVATVAFLHQLHQDVAYREGFEQIRQRFDSLKRNAGLTSTSGDLFSSTSSATANTRYIEEALIVGQDSASNTLVELIQSQQHKSVSRFGLVGKGGAGKTLLLKRVFNSNQVQSLFCNDLMLWLTISQTPSFNSLRNELVKQIALKVNERLQSREEDHVKTWLNQSMAKYKFALFLDDVWETNVISLLEELCVPHSPCHKSNIIIATSRSNSVLLQLAVPPPSIIQMQDLNEDDSWRLFSSHAFPHSDGVLPLSIDQETARHVCNKCGGLPLALKVIGKAMVGITQSNEWEFALQKLQKDVTGSLYSRLRLSYDALANVADYGISLQLCFLCLAVFKEDEVIYYSTATKYWIGEGLLAGPDPHQIGKRYVNLLADRCLIEPLLKDHDGGVLIFRVHDVLHDLAHQIAEKEEKCFFRTGRDLREFPDNDWSAYMRISLRNGSLTRVPKAFRAPHIRSLLLNGNPSLPEIPKEVIGSMTTLRVLDLSRTALLSLPKNMGCLKHLVCLRLRSVPIQTLPNSIAALRMLQILDLSKSKIRQLPSSISRLTSLQVLHVGSCEHLLSMPCGISRLKSLQYLNVYGSPNAWAKIGWNSCTRDLLSINDLGALKQLTKLSLANYGKIIREGILGKMEQMKYLTLDLTNMESLPQDMTAMSKLRKFSLTCPQLRRIEFSFSGFHDLSYVNLFNCNMLEEVPDLHKLPSLKHLKIIECPSIGKFPEEFGKGGAFPKLEEFSIVELEKLQQMPMVEDGSLPSLKTLTIMKCEALQILPECYWNLKSVEKIRVYGCSKVLTAMQDNFIVTNTKVQLVRLSATDTQSEKPYGEEENRLIMLEREYRPALTLGQY